MHSRIYAERFDLALKKLADAVEKLAERGLVQAEPMPVERDQRILELFRLEYAADVLGQLAENDGLVITEAEAPKPRAKKTSSKKPQEPKVEPESEAPAAPEPASEEVEVPAEEQADPEAEAPVKEG